MQCAIIVYYTESMSVRSERRTTSAVPVAQDPAGVDGTAVDPALIDAVLAASRVVVAVATRALAGVAPDVTLPQFRTLVLLDQHGTISVRELAESLGTAPSTASRMCDRLVAKGLLARGPHPDDRRQVQLSVTAAGRRLVARSTARRRAEFEGLLSAMPRGRQAELTRALTAFIDVAGR